MAAANSVRSAKPKKTKLSTMVSEPEAQDTHSAPGPEEGVRWGWVALLAVGVALFGGAAYLAHAGTVTGLELTTFRFINDWPDALRTVFRIATIAPESLWIGVVAVVTAFTFKMYRIAWQLAAGIVGGFAAAFIGKHLIGRARPGDILSDVHVRIHETGPGFPSGHTMMMTVLILVLWPYLPRGWRWGIALVFIPLMALSRIYLGVHVPLDVVGGFAVGAIVVSIMRVMPLKLRSFFHLY